MGPAHGGRHPAGLSLIHAVVSRLTRVQRPVHNQTVWPRRPDDHDDVCLKGLERRKDLKI